MASQNAVFHFCSAQRHRKEIRIYAKWVNPQYIVLKTVNILMYLDTAKLLSEKAGKIHNGSDKKQGSSFILL